VKAENPFRDVPLLDPRDQIASLLAENQRLREALEAIGRCGDVDSDRQAARVLASCVKAARLALSGGKEGA